MVGTGEETKPPMPAIRGLVPLLALVDEASDVFDWYIELRYWL